MQAVVFHDVGKIALEQVPEPRVEQPTDAIVRITTTAICGTDLHMVRGTMPGMQPGTILGHEAVGVVEEVGKNVRNLEPGDRVIIPSTIACGICAYCRYGYYAQCDNANPNGKRAGTTFFGGPRPSGPIQGLQAELARVPFAHVGLVRAPDDLSDERAILLSDIAPTGWFGADLANIHPGSSVAIFGCGPVGVFAVVAARMMGAGRVFAVDRVPDRLRAARKQGAEVIDFSVEDPVEVLLELTGGIGLDRAIDAVGVDAEPRTSAGESGSDGGFSREVQQVAPEADPDAEHFRPGQAPSQALRWAVKSLAKAGTLSIIGVYPQTMQSFPIGEVMMKNLTLRSGNCNHRKYIPRLVELTRTGAFDPLEVLAHKSEIENVIRAYEHFDHRDEGWLKVALEA